MHALNYERALTSCDATKPLEMKKTKVRENTKNKKNQKKIKPATPRNNPKRKLAVLYERGKSV